MTKIMQSKINTIVLPNILNTFSTTSPNHSILPKTSHYNIILLSETTSTHSTHLHTSIPSLPSYHIGHSSIPILLLNSTNTRLITHTLPCPSHHNIPIHIDQHLDTVMIDNIHFDVGERPIPLVTIDQIKPPHSTSRIHKTPQNPFHTTLSTTQIPNTYFHSHTHNIIILITFLYEMVSGIMFNNGNTIVMTKKICGYDQQNQGCYNKQCMCQKLS